MTDPDGRPTDTVAEVAERLMREFGLIASLDTVTACVLSASDDLGRLALDHVPPTLLDRLARARLLEAMNSSTAPSHPARPRS